MDLKMVFCRYKAVSEQTEWHIAPGRHLHTPINSLYQDGTPQAHIQQ